MSHEVIPLFVFAVCIQYADPIVAPRSGDLRSTLEVSDPSGMEQLAVGKELCLMNEEITGIR